MFGGHGPSENSGQQVEETRSGQRAAHGISSTKRSSKRHRDIRGQPSSVRSTLNFSVHQAGTVRSEFLGLIAKLTHEGSSDFPPNGRLDHATKAVCEFTRKYLFQSIRGAKLGESPQTSR